MLTFKLKTSGLRLKFATAYTCVVLVANRGRVYSGGDMKLIANEDISNEYSYIRSNGDLTIEGNDFYNPSTELILSEAKK